MRPAGCARKSSTAWRFWLCGPWRTQLCRIALSRSHSRRGALSFWFTTMPVTRCWVLRLILKQAMADRAFAHPAVAIVAQPLVRGARLPPAHIGEPVDVAHIELQPVGDRTHGGQIRQRAALQRERARAHAG